VALPESRSLKPVAFSLRLLAAPVTGLPDLFLKNTADVR